jgi:guanylate kinase
MTNKIFTKILHKLNKRMADQGRHVLLFVDNCSAHTVTNDYSNIKIIFLPPNTTSRLQPMDQEGTYDSFKTIYRNKLVIKLLDQLKSAKNK